MTRCVTLELLVYIHYVFEEEGAKGSIVLHMACNLPPVHRSWVPITDSGGVMTVALVRRIQPSSLELR